MSRFCLYKKLYPKEDELEDEEFEHLDIFKEYIKPDLHGYCEKSKYKKSFYCGTNSWSHVEYIVEKFGYSCTDQYVNGHLMRTKCLKKKYPEIYITRHDHRWYFIEAEDHEFD